MDMEDIVFNVRDHTINLSHKKLTPQGITNILQKIGNFDHNLRNERIDVLVESRCLVNTGTKKELSFAIQY